MKTDHYKPFAKITLLAILLASSSCGKAFLKMTSGGSNGSASFQLDENSVFNDFKTRCGGTTAEFSDPNNPFLVLSLKSLPIVTKGKQDDIEFIVTAEATANIQSKGGASTTEIDARITGVSATSNGVVMTEAALNKSVRPIAEDTIAKARGKSLGGKSVASTTLLKMHRDDGPYKGIFCSVGYTLGSANTIGGEKGEIAYEQPLPGALNPKAALDTYATELGDGKTFTTNVKILSAKKGWVPVGKSIPITLAIKKIPPTLQGLPGLPSDMVVPEIKADVAYEFVVTGPEGILVSNFGMVKRQVFFVDTNLKTFAAVVSVDDKVGANNVALPPIVLIRN